MKKSLVLAMAMALGVTASAYAANPFSDVPAGHWAYDSISKLADAGVIEGYGDTTFGGDKLMTRYEMAQIVAKAMARGANVDRLAAEFADELDALGVRVANLEKKADNVKITGQIRYSYKEGHGRPAGHQQRLRTRLWLNGAINDDWTYTGMLENIQELDNNSGDETTKFQRAYVNGKLGGLKVQAGRYHFNSFDAGLLGKLVYGNRMDGIQASYGKDVKLTVGYGKADPIDGAITKTGKEKADEMWYANLGGQFKSLDAHVAYYNLKDMSRYTESGVFTKQDAGTDDEIWNVGLGYKFGSSTKLSFDYFHSDYDGAAKNADDDGYMVGLAYKGAKAAKAGSWGLNAGYYDIGAGIDIANSWNAYATGALDNGYKGYHVAANYAFAKNIVGQVEYYDLKNKVTDEKEQTLWSQLVFTF